MRTVVLSMLTLALSTAVADAQFISHRSRTVTVTRSHGRFATGNVQNFFFQPAPVVVQQQPAVIQQAPMAYPQLQASPQFTPSCGTGSCGVSPSQAALQRALQLRALGY